MRAHPRTPCEIAKLRHIRHGSVRAGHGEFGQEGRGSRIGNHAQEIPDYDKVYMDESVEQKLAM